MPMTTKPRGHARKIGRGAAKAAAASQPASMQAVIVPLDPRLLVPDLLNPRGEADPKSAVVKGIAASLPIVGLLQPIIVRDTGKMVGGQPKWSYVAGGRRVAAARLAGWDHIDARILANGETGVDAGLAALVENLAREAMHPVALWRAIARLTGEGQKLTPQAVGDTLGISLAMVRRLQRLGGLAPELLEAMAQEAEIPVDHTLRQIVMAGHAEQRRALAETRKRLGKNASVGRWFWGEVANALQVVRIPRAAAIFDIEAHPKITWDEDLFAEPGSAEQYTTRDLEAFREAQHAALEARCAASKGREEMTVIIDPDVRGPALPKGWKRSYDPIPKRWAKDDPRRVFSAVLGNGWVASMLAAPAAARAKDERELGRSAADEIHALHGGEEGARGPFTHKALAAIAEAKGQALRARLDDGFADPAEALRTVLLALACENVKLPTVHIYSAEPYRDLAQRLVNAAGEPVRISDADLMQLAAGVVGRIVEFPHPKALRSSGAAADWLARSLDTPAPRIDAEDVLAGTNGEQLRLAAQAAEVDAGGTVADLRRRLVGKLENWRPVTFDAPGPKAAPADEAQEAEEIAA